MTIARLPLSNPITSRTYSTAKDSRSVNCLFESSGEYRRIVKRPGVIKQLFNIPNIGDPNNTWNTPTTSTITGSWHADNIVWNGSIYCVIGYAGAGSNYCFTSPDGITWTQRTLPTTAAWQSIAWNGSVFCVAGNGTVGATSPDGITWTARTLPSTGAGAWSAMTYGNGLFVATGWEQAPTFNTYIATSPDGITWTSRTVPTPVQTRGVIWNGTTFVIIGGGISGTNNTTAFTSTNGITWTSRTMPSAYWDSIDWNGTIFLAIPGVTGASTVGATSTDGITWTARTLPASVTWSAINHIGSTFAVVATNSNTTYTTTDGITWTSFTISGTTGTWSVLGTNNTNFVTIDRSATALIANTVGLYTSATTTGRGLFTWDNDILVAQMTKLYRVTGQSATLLGSIQGTLPVSFVETGNDAYVALHDGASLYYIDKATKTFTSPSGSVSNVSIDNAGGYYGYATACTVAAGTPPTITATAHGLVVGQGVTFTATTLPAGLTLGTTYQVASVPTADTFTINTATTGGGVGTAVAVTTTGTAVSFIASPTVTFSAGTVTAKGVATLYNHQVSGVIITTAGTYTTPPTATFSAPAAGTSAALHILFGKDGAGRLTRQNILDNAGVGYLTAPTITFPASVMAGVTPVGYTTLTSGNSVASFTITNEASYPLLALGGISTETCTATVSAPPATTALGTVVMASGGLTGPFAYGIEYLDGYAFVLTSAGRIYQSNLEDPTTWGALNYIEVNADPDKAVALTRQLNYLVAFGQWSTEVFYNAGNATGSILNNNKGGKLEIGCAAGPSVAKAEQTVLWMGQSKTEGRSVYLMEGLAPIKVSNKYIEKYLNASNLSQVYSYCMKLSGHTLYVLTLEDLNITLIYDLDEKEWYQWTSQSAGVEGYFQYTAFNANVEYSPALYLQHHTNGQVYIMSTTATADDVDAIYFRTVSALTDSGTTKRKFYIRAEIVGDKVVGAAQIRHTSDDYQTWSTYRSVSLIAKRPILYQLGESRRRAWEILITDNIPVRLEAIELDFDVGEIGAS